MDNIIRVGEHGIPVDRDDFKMQRMILCRETMSRLRPQGPRTEDPIGSSRPEDIYAELWTM